MPTCPACGKELPGEFPFCPFCGAPLTEQAATSAQEERKIVTVLFCDLVGFTSASDAADPEDVRSRIRPYHGRLRQEIERHGGTVEKFIGDAVMAVFGAPVAHEDDAERAVRSGLRILEAIEELNEHDPALSLQVRIGIDTGEAVVALGARPEEGEGIVTGDVVNTASRLQGAAPIDGIAVSEQTYRATERVFDYEELDPVAVKGKAGRLAVYRPLSSRARIGSDVTRTHTTPLVGRELEKPLLIGTFERSAQQRSCQLVTIVGEPGVGKSRLCAELFAYIEERPGLTRWRQGRCLPYGEGIAFWALGEIVKAEYGILESDSFDEAEAKLDHTLSADDPDDAWLKARLLPLVGGGGEPASQEESFTAWRRCIEQWAEARETVIVIEDLHWADDALLAFLERLADWSEGVPLLLLCTARPELYEQHPTWAAGLRNATTINLPPLTDEETAVLISSLLERAVLPADTQQTLLEHAGGNPLYAEEFVRLLSDREQLSGAVAEVPDTVQALIAARLDTLNSERKSLLQDASVLGKVFWAGALVEMGGRQLADVELALHELARKELVRPARTSSMQGEAEYGFWHLLVRDVCYAQIPRAGRMARHRAAASWLERKAGERAEDLADVLAHHYLTALELARASGQTEEGQDLESRAIRYLTLSGERALALDVNRAEQSLAKALELAPAGHEERAFLLERWANAARQQNRLQEATDGLEEALTMHRAQGDSLGAGRALTALGGMLERIGDPRGWELIGEAITLLEEQPPGAELVDAYAVLAGMHYVSSAYAEAIAAADRALALAANLDLPESPRALGNRGAARAFLGDRQGLEDLRRGQQLALEQGDGRGVAVNHHNLAIATWLYEGPRVALERAREGTDFSERRGIAEAALYLASESLHLLSELGRTEQALVEAADVAERFQGARFGPSVIEALSLQARLLVARGAHEQAPEADNLMALARENGETWAWAYATAAVAKLLLLRDRPQEARAILVELDQVANIRVDPYYASVLPELVRTAIALEAPELAARLVDGVEPRTPLVEHALTTCRALLAEAAGEQADAAAVYAEAAERWHTFENVPERAYARLGEGRCLTALGNPEAAQAPLGEARELFASMGYAPALAEVDALLGHSTAAAL